MAPLQTKPYMFENKEGQFLKSLGARVYIKANSEQTGGMFNLFEAYCPPDFTTSMHIHYMEDVAVYVLEGTFTFFWGREKKEATTGSYFYLPRGTPHGFRVEGRIPARMLYITLPAGFDRFLIELQQPAPEITRERHAAQHKIEILEPPLP